jgi:DNA (cytosine-5)-methyltransferase 1
MNLRVGSLFTGYGGLDIAVGGELAWYAEIEPAACKVLANHYPGVPNLGDITKIDWSEVESVDVITGGYPCQPFSHAGNRKGKNDVRHLWPNVLDAIRAIRPRYAILENVSGHLSLGFADVLADLAQIGWSCEWGTFRASDVGAPHRRERIFIVAYATRGIRGEGQGRDYQESKGATGLATHSGQLTTDTSGDGHGQQLHARAMASVEGQATGSPQQRQRSRREPDAGSVDDAANTDNKRAGIHGGIGGQGRQPGGTLGSTVLRSNDGQVGANGLGAVCSVDTGSVDNATDSDNGHGQTVGAMQGLRRGHASRSDMRDLPDIDWGKYGPAIARWERILDRAAPAPTTPGRNDRPRLNPQFVEWMMGLPDGWVTGHGLSAAKELKMLGNGVVPLQAHAAITQLLERTQQ